MRALRATIALALVTACGSPEAPAPAPPRLTWSAPAPAELCAVEPELRALALAPLPSPAAPRPRASRSQQPPRLFGVRPDAVRTPPPFLAGEAAPARGTLLDDAFRVVRELRREGVARVEVPAGTLRLHVSGDRASVVLSGTF